MNDKIICQNKKAHFEYHIIETYVAGIVLQGTEIKSLRFKGASFNDSYCFVQNNEVFVTGFHIPKYDMGNIFNHDPDRDKKLLLNKKEIIRLKTKRSQEGYTIIPLKAFLEHGLCKLEIAVVVGKKLYDKRESLKERDELRYLKKHY